MPQSNKIGHPWSMGTKAADKHLSMAEQADKYELYEASVQNVEYEVEFVQNTYQAIRGRKAYFLREDFCGTASAASEWAKQGRKYQSIGVDVDSSVLEWGQKNRVGKLESEDQLRVQLIQANVLDVETPIVDVLLAFNFSYWIFDTRPKMLEYFEKVYASLKSDGIFFCDIFGGSEAFEEMKEQTEHDGFTYVWHQEEFHPITHFMRTHIHFAFPDGSKIKKAFTYEWRLWTAPEICELLLEAGFENPVVYWEQEDEDGEGNGEYCPESKGDADLAWISYIVAPK
tara:strand:- start:90 stop:944 length:855 start_codon:yes stop_codon:yes gene_type:complete